MKVEIPLQESRMSWQDVFLNVVLLAALVTLCVLAAIGLGAVFTYLN